MIDLISNLIYLLLCSVLGILLEGIRRHEGFRVFTSLLSFEVTGQFKNPSVQRYIHDLSADIGEHIEELTSSLSVFIGVGKFLI